MVLPIAIIAGAAAVTMLSSAYAAYKTGKISKEQLGAAKTAAKKYEDSLEAPPGTAPAFTPEEFAQIQKYAPEIPQYIQETQPQMITEAGSQTEIRAQKEGLSDLRSRVMSGKDVISDAQQEEALFNADAQAKGRREQLLQSLASRGLSGSGQDILAQVDSSQQAQQNARQQSLDAAKGAEQRRVNALGQMTTLASNVRGQNRQTEQTNVDIMNSYNQRLASGQNQYNQNVANTNNTAQRMNIENEAQINGQNVNLRNASGLRNMQAQVQAKDDVRNFNNRKAETIFNNARGVNQIATDGARNNVANWTGVVNAGASGAAQVGAGMMANEQSELNRQAMTKTGKYKTASLYEPKNDTISALDYEDEFRRKEMEV